MHALSTTPADGNGPPLIQGTARENGNFFFFKPSGFDLIAAFTCQTLKAATHPSSGIVAGHHTRPVFL